MILSVGLCVVNSKRIASSLINKHRHFVFTFIVPVQVTQNIKVSYAQEQNSRKLSLTHL